MKVLIEKANNRLFVEKQNDNGERLESYSPTNTSSAIAVAEALLEGKEPPKNYRSIKAHRIQRQLQ